MKFIYYYFFITLLYFFERVWIIGGSTDLSIAELRHLSDKLHGEQCVKLLESLYLRTPGYTLKDEQKLTQLSSSEECQLKLEQWNNTFPGKKNKRARVHIIKILQAIGRVDLANYIKRSKRIAELLHNIKYLPRRYRKHLEELKKRNKAKKLKLKSNKLFNKPRAVSTLVERQAKSEDGYSTRWIVVIICFLLLVATIIATACIAIYRSRSKTQKMPLNQISGCYPHCKGYKRFPPDVEDGWASSMSDLPQGKWQKSTPVPTLPLTESEPEKKPEKKSEKKPRKKERKRQSSNKCQVRSKEVQPVEKIIEKEPKVEKERKVKKEKKEKPKCESESEVTSCGSPNLIDAQEIANILNVHDANCQCCGCKAKTDDPAGRKSYCPDESCQYSKREKIMTHIAPHSTTDRGIKKLGSFFKSSASKGSKLFKNRKLSEERRSSSQSSLSDNLQCGATSESPPTTRRSKSKSPQPPSPPPLPPPPFPPPLPREHRKNSKVTEKSPKKEKSSQRNSPEKNPPKSPPKSPKKSALQCVKKSCSLRNRSPRDSKDKNSKQSRNSKN